MTLQQSHNNYPVLVTVFMSCMKNKYTLYVSLTGLNKTGYDRVYKDSLRVCKISPETYHTTPPPFLLSPLLTIHHRCKKGKLNREWTRKRQTRVFVCLVIVMGNNCTISNACICIPSIHPYLSLLLAFCCC